MQISPAPLSPMASLRFDLVERIFAELAPRTIVELGCGQGAVGTRLAAGARYTGVEPDHESCEVARSRLAGTTGQIIAGDHTCLPSDAVYDVVCAFEVLEHIEHDEKALTDWVTLIRPGGHLVLSVPAWPSRFGPMDVAVGHFRRYSPDGLTNVLRGAGLTDVRVLLYGWPLGYGLEFARERLARQRASHTQAMTVAERTACSGRLFQPTAMLGPVVRTATLPFRYVQRLAPTRGTGIVAVAARPAAP